MAIEDRHQSRKGTRYQVLYRDAFGKQRSQTFDDLGEAKEYDAKTSLVLATCKCPDGSGTDPRGIRVAAVTLEKGHILCAICGASFKAQC